MNSELQTYLIRQQLQQQRNNDNQAQNFISPKAEQEPYVIEVKVDRHGDATVVRGADMLDGGLHTFYTAPPQREWVSLTDDEIREAVSGDPFASRIDVARAIEAKLKEKNK